MKILIVYSSTDGQTRKICRYAMDRLANQDANVELLPAADAEGIDLSRFQGVILAASVHAGHYQRALTDFVAQNAEVLNDMHTMFLSVSLAASGHNAEDWRGLDDIAKDFFEVTGVRPTRTVHVAGAYTPSCYDIFRRFIMRRIIIARDPETNPDVDVEYTDWAALDEILDDWTAGAS